MKSPMIYGSILLVLICALPTAQAQQTFQPQMVQDPTLNNLAHPEGYETAEPGTLGRVTRVGNGPQDMVLVAGSGFGGEIFDGFVESWNDRFTMYVVTLPGFGGTPALPMPEAGVSYGDQSWTVAARDAVARLIEEEQLDRPVLVGHWVNSTQVILGLALQRPDLVRSAILISGVPKFLSVPGSGFPDPKTPQMRAMMVDTMLAPNWFKTVTRETWDDNNYLPVDYAIHPLRQLHRWREAAEPTLPVWVRYLCEAWAADLTLDLHRLEIPLLVVKPQFDEQYALLPQRAAFLQTRLHTAWDGATQQSDLITMRTIEDARVFIMDDQPEKLNEVVEQFLDGPGAQPRRVMSRPTEAPPLQEASTTPNFWGGGLKRTGNRYVLEGGVSLERPDPTWELEAVADQPPLVARMHDPLEKADVAIQIQPAFGASLDTLGPVIVQSLSGIYPSLNVLSTGRTSLGGSEALQIDCTYEKDGETMRVTLLFAKLDDDFLLSITYRATPDQFQALRAQFDRISESVELTRGG